jgi:hypothetical protein
MLEEEVPPLFDGLGEELLLLFDDRERVEVVRGDPRGLQVRGGGNEIAAEDDRLVTRLEAHELQADGVALGDEEVNARVQLGVALEQVQATALLEQREVVGAEAAAVLLAGMVGPVPVPALQVVGGVRERQAQLAAFVAGGAAGVVEVKVRQHHVGDVVAGDAGAGELGVEAEAVVRDAVEIAVSPVPAGADAVVDQDAARAVEHQHAPQAQRDAVAAVGGEVPLPQRPGHHAEHGAAVEGDGAVAHLVDLEMAEAEGHGRSVARNARRAPWYDAGACSKQTTTT